MSIDDIRQKFVSDALDRVIAAQSKDELDDQDKFALAWACGCEVDVVPDEDRNKLVFRTKNPVGFVKKNGIWCVYENVAGEVVHRNATREQLHFDDE